MNKNERKEVRQAAKDSGFWQSGFDQDVQINKYGDTVKHIGENRTRVGDNTYYGASDAIKAITGKK